MSQTPLRAVFLMLLAMTCIPAGDAAGKVLMQDYGASPFFVGFSRFGLGAIVVLAGLLVLGRRPRWRAFADWRLWLRGVLIGGGVACIVSALRTEPLANTFGAFFIGPILSYLLSAWLLKEPVTLARTILLFCGFISVLLVVQPGFGMTPGLALAVLAGLFYGAYLTASRWARDAAPAEELLLTQLVVATLVLAPLGAAWWPPFTGASLLLITASALLSMLGNLLLILAYAQAPASRMAPLVYFQLVAATVLGWSLFGTFPDTLALVGLVGLCLSGFATVLLRR
ncbi:DMT family transporter [Actibacterium sp. 188UL27-1]|uniref:DMT family transporter n=1 Tax=Actibacterium sp. 188UL27-1 TaxID=2786961 RepID=UPI001EF5BB6D|nr:DMT family transporter [Actibacterium sp. 188UL27-1]